MHLHTTAELPAYWDKFVAFEKSHYGPLYVEAKERILGQWLPSRFFFCHFETNDADEVVSCLTFVVFPRDSFGKLLWADQRLGPKDLNAFTVYDINKFDPCIYLASMIISHPRVTPFLVRNISHEMAALRQDLKVHFWDVVAISTNKRSRFLVKRYNFEKIGTCRHETDVWRTDPDRTLMVGIVTGG